MTESLSELGRIAAEYASPPREKKGTVDSTPESVIKATDNLIDSWKAAPFTPDSAKTVLGLAGALKDLSPHRAALAKKHVGRRLELVIPKTSDISGVVGAALRLNVLEEKIGVSPRPRLDEAHVATRHLDVVSDKDRRESTQGVIMSNVDGRLTSSCSDLFSVAQEANKIASHGDRALFKDPSTGRLFVGFYDVKPLTFKTYYPIFYGTTYQKDIPYDILKDGSLILTASEIKALATKAIKNYPCPGGDKNRNPIKFTTTLTVWVDIAARLKARGQFPFPAGIFFEFPKALFAHLEDFEIKSNWL